jgi:hypothetical protein
LLIFYFSLVRINSIGKSEGEREKEKAIWFMAQMEEVVLWINSIKSGFSLWQGCPLFYSLWLS